MRRKAEQVGRPTDRVPARERPPRYTIISFPNCIFLTLKICSGTPSIEKCKKLKKKLDLLKDVEALDSQNILGQFFIQINCWFVNEMWFFGRWDEKQKIKWAKASAEAQGGIFQFRFRPEAGQEKVFQDQGPCRLGIRLILWCLRKFS